MSMKCIYCKQERPSKKSLAAHQPKCPDNPDRRYVSYTLGKPAWNKGRTKETDHRVLKNSVSLKSTLDSYKEQGIKVGFARDDFWTPEMRRRKSEWRKELHRRDPASHPNRKLAGNRSKMSYPERVAFDFLVSQKVDFEHQKKIQNFFVDFLIDDSIVIEIDGEYWHDPEKDVARDEILTSLGYEVFRIKSKDRIEIKLSEIIGV